MNKYILDIIQEVEIEVINNNSLSEIEKYNLLFKNKNKLIIEKILNNKHDTLKNKKDVNSYLYDNSSSISDYLNVSNFPTFQMSKFGVLELTKDNIKIRSMIKFVKENFIYLIIYSNDRYNDLKNIKLEHDDIIVSDTSCVFLTYKYKKYRLLKHEDYKYIEIEEDIKFI